MIGARLGTRTRLRRLVARAAADSLAAFVVPDARTARSMGLDLPAAGLDVVSSPRHASVLVVVNPLPRGLAEAAAIAYAQMPRPRTLLVLGADVAASLPHADVITTSTQQGLIDGVARIRNQIAYRSWSSAPEPFTAPVLEQAKGDDGDIDHSGMHHSQSMDHSGHDMGSSDPHAGHQVPPQADKPAAQASHDAEAPDDHHSHMHQALGSAADDHGAVRDASHATLGHDAMDHTGHEAMADDPAPSADAHDGMDHDAMGHGDHAGMDPSNHAEMDHSEMLHGNHGGMNHEAMGHGGMDHSMMSHDHHMMDGGFMSMIAMTQDLPRSRDGLPMEWVETPFGPLFAGLPGGLASVLTLDGDTVATATLTTGATHRDMAASLPGPIATFPNRLATRDPWAPVAYRLLAERALQAIDGSLSRHVSDYGWIGALERERVINHLGWLAAFGEMLGAAWLAKRAAELQLGLIHAMDIGTTIQLRSPINRLLRDVGRIPLLRRRLTGIGAINSATAAIAHGPVARASGVAADTRTGEIAYQSLGFAPVLRHDGDAFARLQVRLADIGQALDLLGAAGSLTISPLTMTPHFSGTGMATIETPRGTASLHIGVDHDYVHMAHLQTPSAAHIALLPSITEGVELADALVGIASLDLSPWEIDQ